MQKYLPGSTFMVKNMPGAGHLVGANATYAAKADGLTIGTFNTGLIYAQVIKHDGAKFDLSKMSWIGKATTDPRVHRHRLAFADQDIRRVARAEGAGEFRHLRRRHLVGFRRDPHARQCLQAEPEDSDRL